MAERSSLYAKIFIDKAARDTFLGSEIQSPSNYTDWLSWLEGRKMYGDGFTQDKIDNYEYFTTSVSGYLKDWLVHPDEPGNGFSEFDRTKGIWTLSIMQFAENYSAFLGFLNVLRSVDRLTKKEEHSFILIHNFLFAGNESDTVVEITDQKSKILPSIPGQYLQEAITHLQHRIDYEEGYEDW